MSDGELVRTLDDVAALRGRQAVHADIKPAPKVEVWIAVGLRRRWRVVSLGHTYGEWDELGDATRFLYLLADGNPDLEVLR